MRRQFVLRELLQSEQHVDRLRTNRFGVLQINVERPLVLGPSQTPEDAISCGSTQVKRTRPNPGIEFRLGNLSAAGILNRYLKRAISDFVVGFVKRPPANFATGSPVPEGECTSFTSNGDFDGGNMTGRKLPARSPPSIRVWPEHPTDIGFWWFCFCRRNQKKHGCR